MKTRELVLIARQVAVGIWDSVGDAACGRGLAIQDAAAVCWWVEMLTSPEPAGWALVMA